MRCGARPSQPERETYLTVKQQRQLQFAQANSSCDGCDAFGVTLSYNPFDATTDPMNPRGYFRQVAAAMTLPGDLPRDDPRNFLRGDAGADFGQWATTRDAVPPIPGIPAGPVVSGPFVPGPAVPTGRTGRPRVALSGASATG